MAIKFIDKVSDDNKPKKTAAAKPAPCEAIEPEPAPAAPPAGKTTEGEGYLPGLAHHKPEPRPRGRKKAFG